MSVAPGDAVIGCYVSPAVASPWQGSISRRVPLHVIAHRLSLISTRTQLLQHIVSLQTQSKTLVRSSDRHRRLP